MSFGSKIAENGLKNDIFIVKMQVPSLKWVYSFPTRSLSNYRLDCVYKLISKYNVGLKTLLSEDFSEPEFYGDFVGLQI